MGGKVDVVVGLDVFAKNENELRGVTLRGGVVGGSGGGDGDGGEEDGGRGEDGGGGEDSDRVVTDLGVELGENICVVLANGGAAVFVLVTEFPV